MRINHLLLTSVFLASSVCGSLADPVTYTFTVVGPSTGLEGTLNGTPIVSPGSETNAVFTFTGDTSNAEAFNIPGAHGWINSIGSGSFEILNLDNSVVVSGTFDASDNIFVSVDNANGGVGFGSNFAASGSGFPGDPVYPVGILFNPSTTQYDLQSDITINGTGSITCPGFPGACTTPFDLSTSKGELVLSGPDGSPRFPGGVFSAEVTASPVPEPATWSIMLLGFGMIGYLGYSRRRVIA